MILVKKSKRGITFVALIITIIILLILAGISIMLINKSGLLEKAEIAKDKYENAQKVENDILKMYEDKIVEASRGNEVKTDLTIILSNGVSINPSIEVEVKEVFENAVYIYIANGKIVHHLDTNTCIIENLEFNTKYNITVFVVEGNGNIHKGTKTITTKTENIDAFGKISESGKTIADFGMSYTYSGKAETLYKDLYKLGMGSSDGINTNKYTLTIDYQTLIAQMENKEFTGIYGQFVQHCATSSSSYTSTAQSSIIITYDDETTTTVSTVKTSAKNTSKTEEPFAIAKFENGKNITKIQMILTMYDAYTGGANAYIKYIGLVP